MSGFYPFGWYAFGWIDDGIIPEPTLGDVYEIEGEIDTYEVEFE